MHRPSLDRRRTAARLACDSRLTLSPSKGGAQAAGAHRLPGLGFGRAAARIAVLLDTSGAVLGQPDAEEWVAANTIAFRTFPSSARTRALDRAPEGTIAKDGLGFSAASKGLPGFPIAERFHLLVQPRFLHLGFNFRARKTLAERLRAVGDAPGG